MKKNAALVLSGGGARGIAHMGVIEELENRGYEITSLAGTSMGALVGGIYALGKMDDFKKWMVSLDKFKVFSLIDFTLTRQGFVRGDKVFKKIKEFVPDSNIEDLRVPYVAVATDILKRKEVVFTKGSVFDAIRASVAIPTVLTPVQIKDSLLVDGGVVNNIPIKHIHRNTGDKLIVVNVNADVPLLKPEITKKQEVNQEKLYQKRMKEFYQHFSELLAFNKEEKADKKKSDKEKHQQRLDFFNLINQTLTSMTNTIAEMTLQQYSPDCLVEVSHESCGMFDFYKAEEMIEIGRLAAKKALEKCE